MTDCFEGALIEFACETSKEIHGCSKRSWKGQMMPCKGWKSAWALLACVIVESHEGESCLLMRVREWDISIFCKFCEMLFIGFGTGYWLKRCFFLLKMFFVLKHVFLTMSLMKNIKDWKLGLKSACKFHCKFHWKFLNFQCKLAMQVSKFQCKLSVWCIAFSLSNKDWKKLRLKVYIGTFNSCSESLHWKF